jgi:hypothetical protein
MKSRLAFAAALLLAACAKPGGNNNQQAAAGGESGGGAPATAAAGGFTMQPGEWETNIQTEVAAIANMPTGIRPPNIPPMTTRSCMTPEQVRRTDAALFSGGTNQHGVDCDYRGVTVAGGRIHGTSTCRRSGIEISMTMDGTFTPTSFDIDQQSRMTVAGREQETHTHMIGRRVGECPAGAGGK